ncbi:odorant receptor 131-2-like [Centropristis striata]|uniref:odorant receptor 131-2-like n=1 Tax=Centropristis striata TaxID=184440 RepID=UPI0027E02D1A|nr:odorant receptor 131-2-like [Centropristis striata]
MTNAVESQNNITAKLGLLESVMFATLTTVTCCVFLFINVTMLFTLRSKTVFRETSRYILLFNLLFADTVQMALSQLSYLLAACTIWLTYPVCGVLTMLANLTNAISPLTLVVMSLERFVAVCYPLRHSTIITIRNTAVAVFVVWTFNSLNVLTGLILLLEFPFEDLETLQMKDFCTRERMLLGPMSVVYDKAYTYFVFVSVVVVVTSSYIGVIIAARSASTNKASAQKARNTLLLHLLQVGLSILSSIYIPFVLAISKFLNRLIMLRIVIVIYVCIVIFPRCLSSLIYGIRDQTIRPFLICHLCCGLKRLRNPAKTKFST